MRKYLKLIGRSAVSSARAYFVVLAIGLGVAGGFQLAVGSVWSRQSAQFPKSDFVFIGANMIFWAFLVALIMNVPMAMLGSLLLRDRMWPLVRLGLGRRQFIGLIAGQLGAPVLGSFVLCAALYYPLCSVIQAIPDDVGAPMVGVSVYGMPSLVAIVLAVLSIMVPAAVSVVALSWGVARQAGVSGGGRRSSLVRIVVRGSLAGVGVLIVFAGLRDRSQAGILLTLGLLLIGSSIAASVAPRAVATGWAVSARTLGYRPSLTVTRVLSLVFRDRLGGFCQTLFWITALPCLIFTASAIQTVAEGRGGVAQWDFWILFGCPIVFMLFGFLSSVAILAQLMDRDCGEFVPRGLSVRALRFSVLGVFYGIAVVSLVLVSVAVLLLSTLMSRVWSVDLADAIGHAYWLPVGAVGASLALFSLVLCFSVIRLPSTSSTAL